MSAIYSIFFSCIFLLLAANNLQAKQNCSSTSIEQDLDTIRLLFTSFSEDRNRFLQILDMMFETREPFYSPITFFWLFCNEKIKVNEKEVTVENYVAENIVKYYFKTEEFEDYLRPIKEAFYANDKDKEKALTTFLCNYCKYSYSSKIQSTSVTGCNIDKQGIAYVPEIKLNLEIKSIKNNPVFLIFTDNETTAIEKIISESQLPQYVYVYLSYFLFDRRLASDKREIRFWVAQKITSMLNKGNLLDQDALQNALKWREYVLNKFAPYDRKKILYTIVGLDGKVTYSYSPPEYTEEEKQNIEKYSYRCFIGETYTSLKETRWIRPEEVKILLLKEPFDKFPEQILRYINLERLTISNSDFKSLPDGIKNLKSLRYLELKDGRLENIPESLKELKRLQVISFRNNRLSALPDFLFNFPDLRELDVRGNNLTKIPEITDPTCLKKINSIFILEGNNISEEQIESLRKILPDGVTLK